MPTFLMERDPSIGALISSAPADWERLRNSKRYIIPYGINMLDQVTYGWDFEAGGLTVIQGAEKERKTTLAANMIKNLCMSNRWPPEWRIAVDLAESGLQPAKYRDIMIAMVATEILARWAHFGYTSDVKQLLEQPWGDARAASIVSKIAAIAIDLKFLRYNRRTEDQQRAINYACAICSEWPLDIFGPTREDGSTRSAELSPKRWEWCIHERNTRLIVYDHIQQLDISGGDYERLEMAAPIIAECVVKNPGVNFVAISQTSMGSARDAALGIGRRYARGGKKLAEEANRVFDTSYDSGRDPYAMLIYLSASRDSASCKVSQGIEPSSGVFIGSADFTV